MKIKIQPFKIIFGLCFLLSLKAHGQIEFYYGNPEERYQITQETDDEIINAFLKEHKATTIDFNPNPDSRYPIRVKNKKGNWVLFVDDWSGNNSIFMLKKGKQYSFQLPTKLQESIKMTLATRKNQTYWVNFESEIIESKMAFDEVVFATKIDTLIGDNFSDEVEIIERIAVKIGEKWGVIEPGEYNEPSFYVSRNFLYNTLDELPPATGFNSYQLEMMEQIRKEYYVDLLVALDEHGYYFKGRDKKSKLYGLFMGEGEVSGTIPSNYDNIKRHQNTETFEVWKNGKVGYYNSEFELIKEPVYDEFHFMHLDYTWGCALKKEDVWQLFDAFDGSLLVEGKAKSIEALQEFWLNRYE